MAGPGIDQRIELRKRRIRYFRPVIAQAAIERRENGAIVIRIDNLHRRYPPRPANQPRFAMD